MIYLLVVLAFFIGYYLRELMSVLKRIEARLRILNNKSDKKDDKPPAATFVGEMTRAEIVAMIEEERVEAMNR